ncbi:MAG: phage tail protein [Clostridia bacterium]|nr:phage tail protein [Clostridia bacterium]
MGFEKVYITKQGALLAAKTLQGKKIEFDHAEVGSGNLSGNAVDKTALTTKVLECPIQKVEITENTQAKVSFIFKNTDANNGFYFREIGLFAIDPDTKAKVLYAYTNAGTTAEYINNSIAEKIEKHISINVIVDNAQNVNITLDENQIYVTEKEMEEAINKAITKKGNLYGIKRKVNDNTSSAWERIEDSVGLVAKATKNGEEVQNDFDNRYPWSEIISYNYNVEEKKINAYYGDPTFKFDGSNGEVLTRIPEFYWKREIIDGYEYIYISDYAIAGFNKSEEFSVGRYDACIDEDGKLHSYSGYSPSTNKNITQHRDAAKLLSDEFCMIDYRYFMLQLLYLVEYANYNSQSQLGNGIVSMRYTASDKAIIAGETTNTIVIATNDYFKVGQQIAIGTTVDGVSICKDRTITEIAEYSKDTTEGTAITFDGEPVNIAIGNIIHACAQKEGGCDSLGMKSGCLANDSQHAVIYRGIENIFGNVFNWIDGLNIQEYQAYICRNPEEYTSDKFDGSYIKLGYMNCQERDMYIKKLGFDEKNPDIALPIEIGGGAGSSSGMCDFYYSSEGNRVARVGGYFGNGANAGLWCWNCNSSSTLSSLVCGARLLKHQ